MPPKGTKWRKAEEDGPSVLDQIMAAVLDLSGKVDGMAERVGTLETKVTTQAAAIPQFVPMQHEEAPTHTSAMDELKGVGDTVRGARQKVVGVDGFPRPNNLRQWPDGTTVRLVPDSPTANAIRAWRESGHRAPDPDTLQGTVVGFHFVGSQGDPKYKVRFRGLTPAYGDGFYASELIPA